MIATEPPASGARLFIPPVKMKQLIGVTRLFHATHHCQAGAACSAQVFASPSAIIHPQKETQGLINSPSARSARLELGKST